MIKQPILTVAFLALYTIAAAQRQGDYARLASEAFTLYESGKYTESGAAYNAAFASWGDRGMVNDRYNAACSWALANYPDSAFVQLYRIALKGNYANIKHLSTDPDLESLYEDARWPELLALVKDNKDKEEANYDLALVAKLETIYEEDQKYRMQIDGIEQKYGWDSEEMRAHWEIINEKDSLNLIEIKAILDERDWLGPDVIGRQGSSTLFLVIQHADLATQVHYMPMMKEAVKKGDAQASSLALLIDRVALGQGQLQIYGSQIARDPDSKAYYVRPLSDAESVDDRRAEMGLGPLEDYVGRWGITWYPKEYNEMLPTYIEKQGW